jgi:hypothetical protein
MGNGEVALKPTKLPCGHLFSKWSLQEWFKNNKKNSTCSTCPVCRHVVINEENSFSYPCITCNERYKEQVICSFNGIVDNLEFHRSHLDKRQSRIDKRNIRFANYSRERRRRFDEYATRRRSEIQSLLNQVRRERVLQARPWKHDEIMVEYTGIGSGGERNFTVDKFAEIMHENFPETREMNLQDMIIVSGASLHPVGTDSSDDDEVPVGVQRMARKRRREGSDDEDPVEVQRQRQRSEASSS